MPVCTRAVVYIVCDAFQCFRMSSLVLVRHGESLANNENRFTGWSDVPLTHQGREQATACADQLGSRPFHVAFTSRLHRAQETLRIMLDKLKLSDIPILADSALNDRHYGDLQGILKDDAVSRYGTQQVAQWRRGTMRPPGGETIQECNLRVLRFFLQYVLPALRTGQDVLVVAHNGSIGPLVIQLDTLTPAQIGALDIPFAVPCIYDFTHTDSLNNIRSRIAQALIDFGQ
jgi:2,3-bisphosphoglycerate-dependent phosphoglycerate mutase